MGLLYSVKQRVAVCGGLDSPARVLQNLYICLRRILSNRKGITDSIQGVPIARSRRLETTYCQFFRNGMTIWAGVIDLMRRRVCECRVDTNLNLFGSSSLLARGRRRSSAARSLSVNPSKDVGYTHESNRAKQTALIVRKDLI